MHTHTYCTHLVNTKSCMKTEKIKEPSWRGTVKDMNRNKEDKRKTKETHEPHLELYLGGASWVVNGSRNEDPSLAIDDDSLRVIGHRSFNRTNPRTQNRYRQHIPHYKLQTHITINKNSLEPPQSNDLFFVNIYSLFPCHFILYFFRYSREREKDKGNTSWLCLPLAFSLFERNNGGRENEGLTVFFRPVSVGGFNGLFLRPNGGALQLLLNTGGWSCWEFKWDPLRRPFDWDPRTSWPYSLILTVS